MFPVSSLQTFSIPPGKPRLVSLLQNADYTPLIILEAGKVIHKKRVLSHHQHNEHQSTKEIIRMLKEGQEIAMISDAGTPGISDPGFLLVRECIKEEIEDCIKCKIMLCENKYLHL